MTMCSTIYTSLIGLDVGVGLNIHVRASHCGCGLAATLCASLSVSHVCWFVCWPRRCLLHTRTQVQGGALFMTGCNFMINNGVSLTATVGQGIFVGGACAPK